MYWMMDFILPRPLAETTMPSEEATPRRPVMTISRQRIISASQAGTLPVGMSMTRAVVTSTLSASGSISLPSTVTLL